MHLRSSLWNSSIACLPYRKINIAFSLVPAIRVKARCLTFPLSQTLFINLLDEAEVMQFSRDSNALYQIVKALPPNYTHVVLDEIQKVPKLLDAVQRLMRTVKLNPFLLSMP